MGASHLGLSEVKMKKTAFGILVCLGMMLFVSCHKEVEDPEVSQDEIVILYENDVHCAIDGYPLMAELRDRMKRQTDYVSVVSCGDFLSGGIYGSVSYGEYIVRAMNAVGYDCVTLGNHEFDFQIPRLMENLEALDAEVVCCNFLDQSGNPVFQGYTIKHYGKVDVAFVGVSTPSTITTSTPQYFRNGNGEFIYSFCGDSLNSIVQRMVDNARRQGAEYVVLLSHLGSNDLPPLVATTEGVDVVLDAHTHSVIPQRELLNRNGKNVLWSSTGTAFEYIGCLTIKADGTLSTQLLPTADMPAAENAVRDTVEAIKAECAERGNRVIGTSQVLLTVCDGEGNRRVRNSETNIGDFCADAFREVLGAEIGLVNGGAIRTDIAAGEVTFNDLNAVFPFNNSSSMGTITGQDLLDALEMASRRCPNENGGFLCVSGMRYEIDTTIADGVEADANGMFVRVTGERRVRNVEILASSGTYIPLNPSARYSVAANDYLLKYGGDGILFPSLEVERNEVCPDVEVLERFLSENLHGTISTIYAAPQSRIIIR